MSYLFAPVVSLSEALDLWAGHFASLEITGTPHLVTEEKYVSNDWNPGYYVRTLELVSVRYRHSSRGKWIYDEMAFNPSDSTLKG